MWSAVPGRNSSSQDGFFEAALDAAFEVTRRPAATVLPQLTSLAGQYDALVVNFKFVGGSADPSALKQFGRADVPKVLFVGTAEAANLPSDDVLDHFDLVFKREHLRNFVRYQIYEANKSKLRTTVLGCSPRTISLLNHYRRSTSVQGAPSYFHDVFFSGSTTNAARTDAWETVVHSGLSYVGGLQLRKFCTERDRKYLAAKLLHRRYLKTILKGRINLALEGFGEFTYRHLEIWCAGAFMMSTNSLRNLSLPLGARDGVHYVTYDDQRDLKEKLYFYIRNDTHRERIAAAGREMFLHDYSPGRHGMDFPRAI